MKNIKKHYISILKVTFILTVLIFSLNVHTLNLFPAESLTPEKQHPIVGQIISKLLARYHYNHQKIDDAISSEILDIYLERLDRSRLYFLASDIAGFEQFRYELDDQIKSGQLESAYLIFNTFKNRVEERIEYVMNRIETEFDFNIDEYYPIDRSKANWVESVNELNEWWRKKLKNEALSLKLTGKDWQGIQSALKKRYENFSKRIEQYNSEEVFQYYINALSETFDPHTNYLAPRIAENFAIDMSLTFEGIGAQLTTEDDYTKVVRILPGGPAERSKRLWANDKIIGVGQDVEGEMVDVIGMRLDDVVQKIRGNKGSTVRLELIPSKNTPGSPTTIITLVRDEIILEERAARSETIKLTQDNKTYKLGIIDIPTFYADMVAQRRGKKNYRSTTRDVRALIKKLRQEHVEGILIDLRRNGGGSLQEAIELSGLFIKEGPVVQVKKSDGDIRVENDPDPTLVYDGPLGILVDRYSASASEIFAAAIQDYGRGIIIGGRTFGKGTVQNLLDLNRFVSVGDQSFGQMKVTVAKFYRINGGTTQHRGVIPDILFPSIYDEANIGESAQNHALPWDEISAAMFQLEDHVTKYLSTLRLNSKKRTSNDLEFQFILEDIERYRIQKEQNTILLQYEKRKAERDTLEEQQLARVNARRKAKGLKALKKGEENPDQEDDPDALLVESQHILTDLIALTKAMETAKISNIDEKK